MNYRISIILVLLFSCDNANIESVRGSQLANRNIEEIEKYEQIGNMNQEIIIETKEEEIFENLNSKDVISILMPKASPKNGYVYR